MIGIVFIGSLRYCPYLTKYIKVLTEQNIEYEVLFWNRERGNNNYPQNYIAFEKKSELKKAPFYKVPDFVQFGHWLKRKVINRGYEKLIVLSTLSGVLLASTLVQRYKGKYIFDIRDYSYESIKPFYMIEDQIIKHSAFTCISSAGFKQFLPKCYEYTITHNLSYDDMKFEKHFRKKSEGNVINFVWIGVIRYFEHQSRIIDRLKNDKRFNIIFHGDGPELDKFKKYCDGNCIDNVSFTGRYDNRDKAKLLYDADILNNSYGLKKINEVKYAIANKYYDGLIYGVPQLVETGTHKHEKVSGLGVGIGLDVLNTNFADKLYGYYYSINEDKYNDSRRAEIESVLKEDEQYIDRIRNFVLNNIYKDSV